MIETSKAALVMIDMQRGFIDETSSLCIAQAARSVEACARTLRAARDKKMAILHINRRYAEDGSDVEAVRRDTWIAGGKPLSAADPASLLPPSELAPIDGEDVVFKPRFSAFFRTPVDEMLRTRGIDTVVLIGTTTPNCIRSTCYDALSLDYNVVIVEDATSSRTAEVQSANIADMAFIGAQIISSGEFARFGLVDMRDREAEKRNAVLRG